MLWPSSLFHRGGWPWWKSRAATCPALQTRKTWCWLCTYRRMNLCQEWRAFQFLSNRSRSNCPQSFGPLLQTHSQCSNLCLGIGPAKWCRHTHKWQAHWHARCPSCRQACFCRIRPPPTHRPSTDLERKFQCSQKSLHDSQANISYLRYPWPCHQK